MAELHQTCVNHPGRKAIGICVVTSKPICAECSTRIEGVNYSRQGLEELRRKRGQDQSQGKIFHSLLATSCWLASPLMLWMVFRFFVYIFGLMIELADVPKEL